ncbi:hypothetical protein ABB37_08880 [Leptomonas pyrrhocoris]|uniref:Uncharacterized protein n=1 Tax=Leptomonas pyrrhocoris TaxID=157538 RepID=A0A0N0DRS0_LEPPY|nr:hypothetical protein ABB37_08880 [Leptomonas pyrrhocoris]KPA74872.1 hypothetical protein ABB37_08880 [Leptomonas pyrrhocoris]|eukprot:XP_015653311.1 hypothetical protein ABB37_08880 [Leptomonas pyrrhocoris]
MHKSVVRRYLKYLQHHQAPATPSTVAAFLYTLDISPSSALQYYGILHRFLAKPLDLDQMFAEALRKMKAMTPPPPHPPGDADDVRALPKDPAGDSQRTGCRDVLSGVAHGESLGGCGDATRRGIQGPHGGSDGTHRRFLVPHVDLQGGPRQAGQVRHDHQPQMPRSFVRRWRSCPTRILQWPRCLPSGCAVS